MKFNELTTNARKPRRRVGRGIAAGQGKTAGRGTKGYGARTGSKARPGFAGGQNPIMQALPKLPGFRSHHAKMEHVFTGQLGSVSGKTIDGNSLAEAGIVSSPFVRIKLLNKGEVTKALTVRLQGASAAATAAVEAAGGSVAVVPRIGRPAKSDKTDKSAGGRRKTTAASKAAK